MTDVNSRGMYITIEGSDGSGGTTLTQLLGSRIHTEIGRDTLTTRQPWKWRKLTMETLERGSDESELMFAADRLMNLKEVVIPALKQGTIVISDRGSDSGRVYGRANGSNMDLVHNLANHANGICCPDLTIVLDCFHRTACRRRPEEEPARLLRIQQYYIQQANKYPLRCKLINGEHNTPEETADEAMCYIIAAWARHQYIQDSIQTKGTD